MLTHPFTEIYSFRHDIAIGIHKKTHKLVKCDKTDYCATEMFIDLLIFWPDLIALTKWIQMVSNSNWSDIPISFYN